MLPRHSRLDHDQIGHASHADQFTDDFFRILALIVAVDHALECDPSSADHDFDQVEGQIDASFQQLDSGVGNIGISGDPGAGHTQLNIVDNRSNASDPLGDLLCSVFLVGAIGTTGQNHNAVLNRDADLVGLKTGCQSELVYELAI